MDADDATTDKSGADAGATDSAAQANGSVSVALQDRDGFSAAEGSQNGEGTTSTSGQASAQQAKAARKGRQYRSPLPTGVPLPVPEHESLHTYVQRARNISMFSIAFTLLCAVVGLVFAWRTNSAALLGYGLESLVDVWSSVLVLWRFWGDPDGEGSYFLTTRRRESRASVGIAITFVIIGYITCWQAVVHIIEREPPEKSEILLAIAGTSVIILTWSCFFKWSLAKVLSSSALRKDAVTSGAVATMAATMLVSTAVFKSHPSVWWLDSAVALAVSFVLSMLGIKTLATHPWWRKDFWVEGEIPPEEAHAQHIMQLPFRGSPKRGHAGVQSYVAETGIGLESHEVGNGAEHVGGGDGNGNGMAVDNGHADTADQQFASHRADAV